MRQITLVIHHEDDGWWAEAPELPGFSASGPTLQDLRREAHEGIAFHLDDEAFEVGEIQSIQSTQPPLWRTTTVEGAGVANGRARYAFSSHSETPLPVAL